MRYYRIYIDTDNTEEHYEQLSKILGVVPWKLPDNNISENPHGTWVYELQESETDDPIHFINVFLDLLDSKFAELEEIGVSKNDITFWFLYEYHHQCGMEFHPEEMKRLGESGIVLCIDCWQGEEIPELG
jgi:hypothetical protein